MGWSNSTQENLHLMSIPAVVTFRAAKYTKAPSSNYRKGAAASNQATDLAEPGASKNCRIGDTKALHCLQSNLNGILKIISHSDSSNRHVQHSSSSFAMA
jgi:hypothetical protein